MLVSICTKNDSMIVCFDKTISSKGMTSIAFKFTRQSDLEMSTMRIEVWSEWAWCGGFSCPTSPGLCPIWSHCERWTLVIEPTRRLLFVSLNFPDVDEEFQDWNQSCANGLHLFGWSFAAARFWTIVHSRAVRICDRIRMRGGSVEQYTQIALDFSKKKSKKVWIDRLFAFGVPVHSRSRDWLDLGTNWRNSCYRF